MICHYRIWNDVDGFGGEIGAQNSIFTTYVRNANGSINVSEHSLEKLVRQDAGCVGKAK